MRFGLHILQSGPRSTASGALDMAEAAERLGYDAVWLFDHIIAPTYVAQAYPGSEDGKYPVQPRFPYLETVALMSAIAARTSRVEIGTRVLVSLWRHPVILAKQLATIDDIAGGRLILGVGTGWMNEEFDAVDVPMAKRLARLEEHIALMRGAWRDGISSFSGQFYSHCEAGFFPQPPRSDHSIPILLGGIRDQALRRVARFGDGWCVFTPPGQGTDSFNILSADVLAERIETLKRFCLEEGRDFESLRIVSSGRFDDDPREFEAHARLGVTDCALVSFAPYTAIIDRAAEFIRRHGSSSEPIHI